MKCAKEKRQPLEKCRGIRNRDCRFVRPYMYQKSLEQSRLEFLWESYMIETSIHHLEYSFNELGQNLLSFHPKRDCRASMTNDKKDPKETKTSFTGLDDIISTK